MASGSSSYEGIAMHDNSRAHFGHNLYSNEAQNLPGQTVNGTQNVYINERSSHLRPGRCLSVPFATVSTYSRRPDLSNELETKLARQDGSASPRAVAVIGLGGTGKTQLVLHYIDAHEAEYDTVLWIDARDKETKLASFERCCRALGLLVESSPDDKPLQNLPCVQEVLIWLRARAENKKWLVVIDNADDLSGYASSIIPTGKAGTVLVTSQDGQASRLLGGRIPTVKVDAMQSEEAVRLLGNHLGESVTRGDCYWDLVEKITECLDRLALPLDLAGARISVHVEDWGDVVAALKQYLEDYHHNQERLLRDTEYGKETPYKKTVWTAWETSLSSLKAREESHSGMYPVQLLAFLTQFDRANVQNELFRLASLGLEKACRQLDATIATIPSWLRNLLKKNGNNEWDDFLYRDNIACLLRYALVKPVIEPWKGVTMHGLVQMRARQESTTGLSQWHMIFFYAISLMVHRPDNVRFGRHLTAHLPPNDKLLAGANLTPSKVSMAWLWMSIGDAWNQEGGMKEATELYVKAADVMEETFGEKDFRTLAVESHLALCYLDQGLYKEANVLNSKVLQLREAELGDRHPDSLKSRHQLAMILAKQGHWEESADHNMAILEARREVLGNHHKDTLHTMVTLATAYQNLGKISKTEELEVEVFQSSERLFGRSHPDTIHSMGLLATTYSRQGRYRESNELQLEALQAARDLFGDNHENTLENMRELGVSHLRQGKVKEAEELQVEILERSENIYGSNHPTTLRHMGDLARTRATQGKVTEAEKMMFKVFEQMENVLGEEHPATFGIMDDLAVMLQHQGRWQESEDLVSKAMATSSRALGETHPLTLRVMFSLAYAEKGLGQNNVAVDLMRQCAALSSEVLGEDHAETRKRHEHAVAWSNMDGEAIEDADVDVIDNLQSLWELSMQFTPIVVFVEESKDP